MKILRLMPTAAAAFISAGISATVHAQDAPPVGCYQPIRGFATSLCTDGAACKTQTGIYKIVLRNPEAPAGQRMLVMSGLFEGALIEMPNVCGAVTAQHVLTDRDNVSSISTGPDVACFTGGGDFVNTVEISETLSVTAGTGAYAKLIPGGTVTLSGKLGLKTGINKFMVNPLPGDELCFGY